MLFVVGHNKKDDIAYKDMTNLRFINVRAFRIFYGREVPAAVAAGKRVLNRRAFVVLLSDLHQKIRMCSKCIVSLPGRGDKNSAYVL